MNEWISVLQRVIEENSSEPIPFQDSDDEEGESTTNHESETKEELNLHSLPETPLNPNPPPQKCNSSSFRFLLKLQNNS
jgi:hypothetical protein